MRRVVTEKSEKSALENWLVPPPYIYNSEMDESGFEAEIFASWPDTVESTGRITAAEETVVFKQLHYSAHMLRTLYLKAEKRLTSKSKKLYSTWTQRYHLVRSRLTEANLGLVYEMIGRNRFTNLEHDDLRGEGMMALLRAVDTFDPWRGYRFSTYGCNAIIRAFSRAAGKTAKRTSLVNAPFDPEFEEVDLQAAKHEDEQKFLTERLNIVLDDNTAELTDTERFVIGKRFPMEFGIKKKTLEALGREMNVSKERIRQIQIAAVTKIRSALEADAALQF